MARGTGAAPSPLALTGSSFSADLYLDHRYRNRAISEDQGDVLFVPEVHVVLVHRERAEHIVRALVGRRHVPPPVSREPLLRPVQIVGDAAVLPVVATGTTTRGCTLLGWLGILAGSAAFVGALIVPFNDAGLMMAVALVLRGGLAILDADGAGR